MSWLSRSLHYIATKLSAVWRVVSPKIKADFEKFASEFADVALRAVEEQALSVATGQTKLSNAADVVLKAAEQAGWRIIKTAAVTLVQDVYTATKASAGPLVLPPDAAPEDIEAWDGRVTNPTPNA